MARALGTNRRRVLPTLLHGSAAITAAAVTPAQHTHIYRYIYHIWIYICVCMWVWYCCHSCYCNAPRKMHHLLADTKAQPMVSPLSMGIMCTTVASLAFFCFAFSFAKCFLKFFPKHCFIYWHYINCWVCATRSKAVEVVNSACCCCWQKWLAAMSEIFSRLIS